MVVPESANKVFTDPFFGSVVQGISSVLEDTDFTLTMLIQSAANSGKTLRYLSTGNVDGALVVSHHTGDVFFDAVTESVPVVFGGRPVDGPVDTISVDVDNVAAAEAAVRYLIDRGRTRIATIAGPQNMRPGIDRHDGWLRVLGEAGLTPGPIAFGDFTTVSGGTAVRELLATGLPFDAVFAANDQMALGGYPVLREAGLRIPDDVAVIGFDDSPFSATSEPR
nr:substrate-binding domain-containing protein [Tessaracoccus coleopterorum]